MIGSTSESARRRILGRGSTGLIGVDVGSRAIKVAQIRRSGNGWTAGPCRVVPHAESIDDSNPTRAVSQIAQTLERAWAPSGRWLADRAACLLPASLTEFRTFDVPHAPVDELNRAVITELQAENAAGETEWSYGCWTADSSNPRSQLASVSVLAARHDVSTMVAESLRRRGLDCEVMDGLPFTLARAVTMDRQASNGCVAAIDWGYQTLTITCVSRGRPGYTRVLRHCGVSQVISAASAGLGLEPEESGRILNHFALVCGAAAQATSEVEHTIAEICRPGVQEFLDQVNATLRYAQAQFPEQAAQEIVLFGGGAAFHGIDAAVQAATGLPTRTWTLRSPEPKRYSDDCPQPVMGPAFALAALLEEIT